MPQDKLTAVRIKQQNGQYGPQIPVGAKAENVKYDNMYSVKEVLGNVKTNVGPLQEQIDNIDTEAIAGAVDEWLDEHAATTVVIDDDLVMQGAAADAKQAGKVVTINSETDGNATKLHLNTTNDTVNVALMEDLDNLSDVIAEEFATNKAYAIGQYVFYDGNLYKFTAAHSVGAWNSSQVTQVKIGDEVTNTMDEVDELKIQLSLNYKIFDATVRDINAYIGKESIFDLIDILNFQNAYLNNEAPARFIQSNNQLVSNIIKIGTGAKLNIKVPNGYRIYIQYLNSSLAKDGGIGFYTADTEVETTKDYIALSITKNPYSVSDEISPNEASGFEVIYTVTPINDNLTEQINENKSAIATALKFNRNLYNENIDNLKEPGYYYATLYGGDHITGTLPPTLRAEDGTNGFLTVEAYYNFVTQTLVQFLSGKTFVRGANTSANLVFNPWIEISNPEPEPLKVESRNLWAFGDQDITGYKIIGTQGVTLYPAGKYTFSCNLTADEEYINFNVYMSSGSIAKQVTPAASGKRTIIQINATNPIERFFLQTKSGSYSEHGFTMEDIQFEAIYWSNYEYSDTNAWIPMPYTTDYIDHKIEVNDKIAEYKSNWKGKKILYNGDSITQGISVNNVAKVGYVQVVNKLLDFGVVDNYAIGGTRLAHVEDEANCLVDRLNDMSTDADIVFIMANTNDYASQVPIGTDDSTDTSTYKGALNALFDWLKTNYPQKTVIISTPLTRKINTDPQTSEPLLIAPEQYVEAVRNRVAAYHFVLFDAYAWSGMDLRTSAIDGTGITNDGLHPNEYGAELLGRKVAAFINAQ